ncbi:type III secretion system export apparatus subunit SctS [Actimicrobium sp. CCC2.4]|uniref:type III secretion system export apparatus subunit SctS n=1 Tax=Actimicrobium sp. CCC2.4 TaxID=3048606 RepID=UPI002AC9D784|nr:type III secretion system export apparatus subunit SctS [Actimicrobium sp. CCC2.4]MEB0136380.1 type III secretion system export apparatus subunit SctS [Actimicrobium sp. CCC2.4]WPX31199.1 type III secretion system export apparatus subunit SctS [Actimicrobium sp. CCC2.4]
MADTINFFQQGLWMIIVLSAPPLLVAVLCGTAISLIQAVTQIQDQTLPYVVKLMGVSITLTLMGRWIGSELIQMINAAFVLIPVAGR